MAENLTDIPRSKSRPRLLTLTDDTGERHASWLELFFDLVFVLAVAQVARILVKNSDTAGFLTYAALFLPVWWSWVGFTYHVNIPRRRRLRIRGALTAVKNASGTITNGSTSDFASNAVM